MNSEDLDLTWDTDPRPSLEPLPTPHQFSSGPLEPVNIDIPHQDPHRFVWAVVLTVGLVAAAVLVWLSLWVGSALGYPQSRAQLGLDPNATVVVKVPVTEQKADLPAVSKKRAPLPEPRPQVVVSRATTGTVWSSARASWYGPGLYGGRTADGTAYTPSTWCVAHKTLPFGTKVEINYNGKTVVVPVKDRGPFTPGRDFDLSGAVAQALGFSGVQTIQYRIVR